MKVPPPVDMAGQDVNVGDIVFIPARVVRNTTRQRVWLETLSEHCLPASIVLDARCLYVDAAQAAEVSR